VRILHLSDVHVQADYDRHSWGRIGWRRAVAQLELKVARRARRYVRAPETLAKIAAAAADVDHVVLSGDLTALALDEEFEGVRKALGALADRPDRLTVIPGNHDVYTPGSWRKKRFEKWFGHLLDSDLPEFQVEGPWPTVRLVGDSLAIVGLCSARTPPVPGIAAGWVGEDQLAALGRIAEHPKVKGRAIYAVVHHTPLRWDGTLDRPSHGLKDGGRLMQVAAAAGIAAILAGHIHLRYARVPPAGPALVCGGSSTSAGREGYFVLEDRDGRLAGVHEIDLAGERQAAAEGKPAAEGASIPGTIVPV
jgi:3',5'-cyclic AMP phosphodiesterase CpdA